MDENGDQLGLNGFDVNIDLTQFVKTDPRALAEYKEALHKISKERWSHIQKQDNNHVRYMSLKDAKEIFSLELIQILKDAIALSTPFCLYKIKKKQPSIEFRVLKSVRKENGVSTPAQDPHLDSNSFYEQVKLGVKKIQDASWVGFLSIDDFTFLSSYEWNPDTLQFTTELLEQIPKLTLKLITANHIHAGTIFPPECQDDYHIRVHIEIDGPTKTDSNDQLFFFKGSQPLRKGKATGAAAVFEYNSEEGA